MLLMAGWFKTLTRGAPWLLTLLLVGLALIQQVQFNLTDQRTLDNDGHYNRSVNFFTWLETGDDLWLTRLGEPVMGEVVADASHYPLRSGYPPLMYLLTAPFYEWRGVSPQTARLSMVPCFALLLVGVFLLSTHLAGPWAGLTSLALTLTSPFILYFSRNYMIDFPLATGYVWAMWALVSSDSLRRKGRTLLLGLALTVCLLCKWNAIMFLALPLVLVLMPIARTGRPGRMAILGCLGLATSALLVCGWILSRDLTPASWLVSGRWWRVWALGCVLPSVGLVLLFRRWIHHLAPEIKTHPDTLAATRLVQLTAGVWLLSSPWYVANLPDVYFGYVGHQAVSAAPDSVGFPGLLLDFFAAAFALALPLLLLAAVLAPSDPRARWKVFTLATTTLTCLAILFQTGNTSGFVWVVGQSRLILPPLMLLVVLGGYGIGRMRLLGPVLALGVTTLALIPTLGYQKSQQVMDNLGNLLPKQYDMILTQPSPHRMPQDALLMNNLEGAISESLPGRSTRVVWLLLPPNSVPVRYLDELYADVVRRHHVALIHSFYDEVSLPDPHRSPLNQWDTRRPTLTQVLVVHGQNHPVEEVQALFTLPGWVEPEVVGRWGVMPPLHITSLAVPSAPHLDNYDPADTASSQM